MKQKSAVVFPMTCDVRLTPQPRPPLPDQSFFMLLVGKPGSGKTNMLLNLLLRSPYYARRFDRVYVVSPSMQTLNEDYFLSIPNEQRTNQYTPGFVSQLLNAERDTGHKVLLVLDDVVNQIEENANQRDLLQIVFNRRHVCGAGGFLSILLTSQVYNRVPLRLRKCASTVLLFKTTNKRELDFLFDELIGGIDRAEYYKMLREAFQDKHDFICINTDTQRFFRNLDYEIHPKRSKKNCGYSDTESEESDSDVSSTSSSESE